MESTWREGTGQQREQMLICGLGTQATPGCVRWTVRHEAQSRGYHSARCVILNLRKPNRKFAGSLSKNKNKGGRSTCRRLLWDEKASSNSGFRVRSPVLCASFIFRGSRRKKKADTHLC